MKPLVLALLLAASALISREAAAQTVTCSVSGASSLQATQYATFLAQTNAQRAKDGQAPYANFNAHCADIMVSIFNGWVAKIAEQDSWRLSAAGASHGQEPAAAAQCTAAGLGAGCTKAQVACYVLSGNTSCN